MKRPRHKQSVFLIMVAFTRKTQRQGCQIKYQFFCLRKLRYFFKFFKYFFLICAQVADTEQLFFYICHKNKQKNIIKQT